MLTFIQNLVARRVPVRPSLVLHEDLKKGSRFDIGQIHNEVVCCSGQSTMKLLVDVYLKYSFEDTVLKTSLMI